MKRTIEVVFYREKERWVAQALNVDVSSFGDSLEDARAAIREALGLRFEDESDSDVSRASDVRLEQVRV
jgi:predicted RNase H-like HicB family nuclease